MRTNKGSIVASLKNLILPQPTNPTSSVKLSEKIRELSKVQDTNNYKRDFLIPVHNDNQNLTNTKLKREILLNKLMKEKIPKKDIIKRALEKDSDQFPKEENKEKFFQAIFQNIYNTLSPEARKQLKSEESSFSEEIQKEFNVKYPKIYSPLDNNVIADFSHNFISLNDLYHMNSN